MNFNLSKEERLLQKSVREYLRDRIAPFADAGDREAPLSKDQVLAYLKGLAPFGYLGPLVSADLSGPGLSHVETGLILSDLGKVWAALAAMAFSTSMVISRILASSNHDLIDRYVPPLLSGDRIGAFAWTERGAGTDPGGIQTTAAFSGDHCCVNGEKVWVSNGVLADIVLVAAGFPGPDAVKTGPGLILVEKSGSLPVAVEMPKMGLKGMSSAKISFSGCRVPKDHDLGILARTGCLGAFMSDPEKCQIAAISLGIAEAALDASLSYARQRVQFGKVLGEFQMIQKMIADMATHIDAARLLCFRALKMLDDKTPCFREVEMAKAFALDMAVEITSKAIQIHGAYGYSDEFPLERFYRDACCIALMDGDPDLARLNAARHLMGLSTEN
jgi:acyl-CoA dehydrogenase